jgi:N-acetylneuraminate synthase
MGKRVEQVEIAGRAVGGDAPCVVIAEIGINHNGDLGLARKLVAASVTAGCDAVKFQKRTVDVVYSADELARPRESPFGATNGDLKRGLEFGGPEFEAIDEYCRMLDSWWFASCWDEGSVDFMEQFDPPCYKIASASLTDDALLRHHRKYGRPIILSTGMSDLDEIDHAVEVLGTDDLVLMHATSTYPSQPEELNLRAIVTLQERYGVPVGYSGHEVGLAASVAAVALGACMVEPAGVARLVKDVRAVETALGDGVKVVYDSEIPIKEKLRRVDTRRAASA